jgi:PAS domain S-box-containing protein
MKRIDQSTILYKIQGISLKWKLLIPFLTFSFLGTVILVYIGLSSQQELIKKGEKKECLFLYRLFLTEIEHKKIAALSLATVIAGNPEVQRLLAERDRSGLTELLFPIFKQLREEYGILHFHFHVPPAKSFLRLHLPDVFGEMISYRRTIIDAMKSGKGVAGLESGMAGLGIRGVVPIYYRGALVGSIEIGYPFGRLFLEDLKKSWGADFTVFEKISENTYRRLATTLKGDAEFPLIKYVSQSGKENPVILISPPGYRHKSVLLGAVTDYAGTVVAQVEIEVDRSGIVDRLFKTQALMFAVGAVGILVSFTLVWVVAVAFVRPIKEIVKEAGEIADGKTGITLEPRPADEIGELTHSLTKMTEALNERQAQIKDYARTLELRVKERTADLIASEEKYRTLVEHAPLIVYRILCDGTTEFINPYFTEKLGYSAEDVVGNKQFWRENICGEETCLDRNAPITSWDAAVESRVERTVRDKQGKPLIFMDHAIPQLDERGGIKWIDGIMVDITQLKRLQERALQTEEVRLLGEISARFAHEMRNPLASAGGFARRLRDALSESDPGRKLANIIVEDISRLEKILSIIFSMIEPITLYYSEVDLNELLMAIVEELKNAISSRRIEMVRYLAVSLPKIRGDEALLNRAFENLIKEAILSAPEGEQVTLSTSREGDLVVAVISHPAESVSEEDLAQFFFPRFTAETDSTLLELPLSKIIVHRHGGRIDLHRQEGDVIVIRVELPIEPPDQPGDTAL